MTEIIKNESDKLSIVYLHGFASKFDYDSVKVKGLMQIGNVSGFNIDYTQHQSDILELAINEIHNKEFDLIVGSSMGGWLASQVANSLNLPFVAINPAISPSNLLKPYIGTHEDYYGMNFTLTEPVVTSFSDFSTEGDGLILLDEKDELIDSLKTKHILEPYFQVKMFSGGDHRFQHIEESLDIINSFYADFN